jgi:hypothetical protein
MDRTVEPGDVVQVAPTTDDGYAGCMLVVLSCDRSGVSGYVTLPSLWLDRAYHRVQHGEYAFVGRAPYGFDPVERLS